MEKIGIGFLGCGNIGGAVYKLLEEMSAEIERNEGVAFEVRRILVRNVSKARGLQIPQAVLTDCAQDVLEDQEISIVMEFMGGE